MHKPSPRQYKSGKRVFACLGFFRGDVLGRFGGGLGMFGDVLGRFGRMFEGCVGNMLGHGWDNSGDFIGRF